MVLLTLLLLDSSELFVPNQEADSLAAAIAAAGAELEAENAASPSAAQKRAFRQSVMVCFCFFILFFAATL